MILDAGDDKRAAALAAAAEIESGMLVGLGTGSTVAYLLDALGERVAQGLRITAVATSIATEKRTIDLGIPIRDFADVSRLDLAIDGADEIDARLHAIKGAGGAMLREKIVAEAADRMVVIADGSKRVEKIGGVPVPVEVLPFARAFVAARLEAIGTVLTLRRGVTDQGNLILDCRFADLSDPIRLDAELAAIPGVLGHGLFLREVDAAYIALGGIVTRLERDGRSA